MAYFFPAVATFAHVLCKLSHFTSDNPVSHFLSISHNSTYACLLDRAFVEVCTVCHGGSCSEDLSMQQQVQMRLSVYVVESQQQQVQMRLSVYVVESLCHPNPCRHGGSCSEDLPSKRFRCDCLPGYTSKLCDAGQHRGRQLKRC